MTRGDWLQVRSGKKFYPQSPLAEEIDIKDIAHALSLQCRFGGHVSELYSVAQHCCLVAAHCDREYALWGLLHDASEAYIIDVPRPLKPYLKGYFDIEVNIMTCVCQRFGLPLHMPDHVDRWDHVLCATEMRDLMQPLHPDLSSYLEKYPPLSERITPWSPAGAYNTFLRIFHELYRGD